MGFGRTFMAICSGTEVFIRLFQTRPLKAAAHLITLLLLCSVFITVCRFASIYSVWMKMSTELSKTFGSLEISKSGLAPEKNSGERRAFIASRSFRLDYLPPGKASLKDIDQWQEPSGVLWLRQGLIVWSSFEEAGGTKKYMLLPVKLSSGASSLEKPPYSYITKEAFESYVSKSGLETEAPQTAAKDDQKPLKEGFHAVAIVASFISAGFLFLGSLSASLFLSLSAIVLFSAAQYVWISDPSGRLKFGNILVIILYATFPPLVIASIFYALNLPVLGFQTVFFICFFLYHIIAFNRVQRHLNPIKVPPHEDGGDDF